MRRRALPRRTGTSMTQTTYGKWLACDYDRFIGVMGDSEPEAILNLAAAQKRADAIMARIDKRMDEAPETDVGLLPDELAAIAEAEADLARGDFTTFKAEPTLEERK